MPDTNHNPPQPAPQRLDDPEGQRQSRANAQQATALKGTHYTVDLQPLRYIDSKRRRGRQRNVAIYTAIVAGVSLFFWLIVPWGTTRPNPALFIGGGMGLGLVVLALAPRFKQWLGFRPDYLADDTLRAFCAANGWQYQSLSIAPEKERFIPAVAGLGRKQTTSQALHGSWFGRPLESYLAQASLPNQSDSGKYYVRVWHVRFGEHTVFPPLFLGQRRSANADGLSVLPRHFEPSQRLSLEYAFQEYFVAYSHRGTKTDAVSFLPPNVLETIIHTNRWFDVELVGDSLYLYSKDTSLTPQAFGAAFTVLASLIRHLNHRLTTWKMVLPKDAYPYLASQAGYASLTAHNYRFSSKPLVLGIPIVLGLLRIWASSAYSHHAKVLFTEAVAGVVVIAIVVTVLIRSQQPR